MTTSDSIYTCSWHSFLSVEKAGPFVCSRCNSSFFRLHELSSYGFGELRYQAVCYVCYQSYDVIYNKRNPEHKRLVPCILI